MITASSITNIHKFDVQMYANNIRMMDCVNLLESHGKNADAFQITLRDGENIVDLITSGITGDAYFTDANGTTTTIDGTPYNTIETPYNTVNGSYMEFKLTQACYSVKGPCRIVFVLKNETGFITTENYENRAVMIITGNVV